MALSADRDTPARDGRDYVYPVKGSTTIYAGGLTCLNAAGLAVPGAVATTLKTVGRAEAQVVNSGADSALSVKVKRGVFRFRNSAAGDLIALADVKASCYVVDDQTVAKTDGTGTRSVAGIIEDVDAQGVWVRI